LVAPSGAGKCFPVLTIEFAGSLNSAIAIYLFSK